VISRVKNKKIPQEKKGNGVLQRRKASAWDGTCTKRASGGKGSDGGEGMSHAERKRHGKTIGRRKIGGGTSHWVIGKKKRLRMGDGAWGSREHLRFGLQKGE